ncbi:hypothetical protein [Cupriavidus basilensis]|uniref:Uncharacterized protein n=1 Tax=Cupriavidus basilensis TaxID=68895 RepID=A0A643FJE3_9BURK|nr:hypothetical protein [Cupriavidus basilensis]QOT74857.1 hypothetical protein F7R26_011335 [Cupriavidus basilensis]
MNIPDKLTLRETAHGHGANGMAFYGYEDTAGLGIQMEARRESGRSGFIETWFHEALPERKFATWAELSAAVAALTDEQVEAEAAQYPRFRSIRPDTCGNACRLCPRPSYTGERVKHDTWRVHVARGWRAVTDWRCSLCDTHLNQFDGKPAELIAALEAEAAERRASTAEKGLPW